MTLDKCIAREVWANARPLRDDEGRRITRALRRGVKNRRIIAEKLIDGVEYSYHATKGWRSRQVST